jgi:hypothetical protein
MHQHDPAGAAAVAAAQAQAMLSYFACVPDANGGMMYLPYPHGMDQGQGGPAPPSTVSLGPVSGSSLISPVNTANCSADEVDGAVSTESF